MNIPKIYNKNNKTYRFIKKINDDMFLYEEINYKFKECFSRFDFNLIEATKKGGKPKSER